MPYKILIIPSIHIYPYSSGGSHVLLSFLQKQQHTHKLSLALTPYNIAKKDIPAFQKLLPHVNLIPIGFTQKQNRIKRFMLKQWRKLSDRNAFATLWKTPFLWHILIKDQTVITDIAKLVRKQHFDLVQVEFTQNIGLVSVLPANVKKIYVHHELINPRLTQDMMALKFDEYYSPYISNMVEAIELHSLQQYDGVITLSADDKALLQQKGITKPIDVASNFALFENELQYIFDPAATPHLLFMGSEGHFPNQEGLTWFLDEVMPQIVKGVPDAKLLVTGTWTEAFKTKYQSTHVMFTGFIDDLDPVLKNSISISPIRIGSGIRLKIVTSMAKGAPVVSTTLGASGIEGLLHEQNIMIADEAHKFAHYSIQLLKDQAVRKALSEQAFQLSHDNYTKMDYAEQRNQFYTRIIEGR
jgi:glycosyltransferase involved in cell wall biosynthesis